MYGPLIDYVNAEARRREPWRPLRPFLILWQEAWVKPWLASLPTHPVLTKPALYAGTDGPPAPDRLTYGGVVVPLGQTLDAALAAWAHVAILAAVERGAWVWQAQSWHWLDWCKSVAHVGRN